MQIVALGLLYVLIPITQFSIILANGLSSQFQANGQFFSEQVTFVVQPFIWNYSKCDSLYYAGILVRNYESIIVSFVCLLSVCQLFCLSMSLPEDDQPVSME